MKKARYCQVFLAVLTCVTIAAALPPASRRAQPRQKQLSYDEINSRIVSLQYRSDSLVGALEQLRLDSTRAGQEVARQNTGLSKKLTDLDDALANKRPMAAAAKTQYEKAKADSVAIITKTRDQIVAIRKELQQSGLSLTALNNALALHLSRQDQTGASGGGDEKTILKLQAQVTQRDSLLRERQADIEYLTPKLDKLRQDSSQAEARRIADNNLFHQQVARIDSMIAAADAAIAQLDQKLSAAKSEKEQKAAQLQQGITLLTRQKQNAAAQITRANTELAALDGERTRLSQSSNTARQKYTTLRLPFETALTNAEDEFQKVTKDKQMLIAVRRKFSIDSATFKSRDNLDLAIQAEAERKKGAKKLVEQRENELDLLLRSQDSISRATPGLRMRESQFRAATITQKSALVDSELALSDKKIETAAAQRDKAKLNLAGFEQKNPEPQNTSSVRTAQLDTLIAAKKKEIIQLTSVSDSLNILLQEVQTSTAAPSAKGKTETGRADSMIQNRKNDRNTLSAKRIKIQRDSAQADAAAAASMLRLKTDRGAVNSQIINSKNEIATITAERDKAKQAIIATQEKNRQSQASLAAEKKKSDSIAAAKQDEITQVSAKIEKLRKDSSIVLKQQDQMMKTIIPSPASLADLVTTLDQELLGLQMQRDSIAKAVLAGSNRTGSAVKNIILQISAVNRSIESTQTEIAAMITMKEEAVKRLKNDKATYDSLVGATEQDLAKIIAKRDKARLDSIGAINDVRHASGKGASFLRIHDSIIAARQKELSDITAEYNRLVDDSKKSSEKTSPAQAGFSQSIRAIDAQIASKEKEIADLRVKKEKIKQDSVAEFRSQAGLLAAARTETAKRNSAMLQKKAEVSLALADRKKVQADSASLQKKSLEAVAAATVEIQRLNTLIAGKQAELARVQKEREAVTARIKTTSERGSSVVITDEPAATPSKTPSPADLAQKKADEIYTLLDENRVGEASKKFKSMQPFFKINLDGESFNALKMTIEQMGGAVR